MSKTLPGRVELISAENELLSKIKFDPRGLELDEFQECADAALELTKSLIDRSAIPEIRVRFFTDKELNIPSSKSRKRVFEDNGTSGDAILRHPHFLRFLQYFLYGPNLPDRVIEGLVKIIDDDAGTSGMVLDQVQRFVRATVRDFELDRTTASEEFFKLALELGLDVGYARTIRNAARSAK